MSSKPDEVKATEDNSSPGSRLQIAREALGISQKALADDLYLPRKYILWIEEGAYDKLPSMVFCRGYIRAYAKAVNENGSELIALLDQIYGSPNINAPLLSVSKIDEQVKVGDPIMRWSSLIFVLILCALVFWWWDKQYGLSAPFMDTSGEVSIETVNGDELVLQSLSSDIIVASSSNNLLTQELVESPTLSSPAPVEITEVESPPVIEPTVAPANEIIRNGTGIALALNITEDASDSVEMAELEKVVKALEPTPQPVAEVSEIAIETQVPEETTVVLADIKLLLIKFNNECWVTIKDARGKTLFNGIKKSGEQLSLSGDTPLNISIGRMDSVSEITFGGTVIDLNALGRNNIANFRLPL